MGSLDQGPTQQCTAHAGADADGTGSTALRDQCNHEVLGADSREGILDHL